MPEGILCNRTPINTKEQLDATLADTRGRQYYEEMASLDVDREKLANSLKATCKSRLRTWLEICAHCGLCADSCFLYLANKKDPTQVPAYKIQSTLGKIVQRNGDKFITVRESQEITRRRPLRRFVFQPMGAAKYRAFVRAVCIHHRVINQYWSIG